MKRFSVTYESDKYNNMIYNRATGEYGSYDHSYGTYASSVKTCKGYIKSIRKDYASENPRNFRVFDSWQEDEDGYSLCVYQEY